MRNKQALKLTLRKKPQADLRVFGQSIRPQATWYGTDSCYIPNFLQQYVGLNPEGVLLELKQQAPWVDRLAKEMRNRGRPLPRTKFFLVRPQDEPEDVDEPPERMPCYRYPGWQWVSMLHYRPFQRVPVVQLLADWCEQHLEYRSCGSVKEERYRKVKVNHVIGTKYVDGNDKIGFHDDKMDDIAAWSPILIFSFGERRELHLAADDDEALTKYKCIVLEPGSLFVLGPDTNQRWKHSIVPVREESRIPRIPRVKVGVRVSLVLRETHKTVCLDEVKKHCK